MRQRLISKLKIETVAIFASIVRLTEIKVFIFEPGLYLKTDPRGTVLIIFVAITSAFVAGSAESAGLIFIGLFSAGTALNRLFHS